MVSKYSGSEEEKWQMKSLCRFHGFELSMPKRPVSYAEDQPVGRYHVRASEDELLGRLSRVSSDCPCTQGPREDNYHYTVMPFGLKNAGALYQRMIKRMF